MRARTIIVAIGALVAVSCSTPEAEPEPVAVEDAEAEVVEAPEPEPVEEAPEDDSLDSEATCLEVFDHLESAADIFGALADHPDGSTIDYDELTTTTQAIEQVASVAPDDMAPLLEAQAEPLRDLVGIFDGDADQALQLDDFRTSGIELATRCREYAD